MGDAGGTKSDRRFKLGKGLLGVFVVGSLLGCFGGGCELDLSGLDPENKPDLGLTRTETGELVVLVPSCVGSVERILLLDDKNEPVWDVAASAPTALPTSFNLGAAPPGFLTTAIPLGELEPTRSYRLLVGPDFDHSAPITGPSTAPSTTASSTSTSTSTGASVPPGAGGSTTTVTTAPSTTSSPSTISSESESVFLLLAEGVADFRPDQVTSQHILVDSSQIGLADFSARACAKPSTTTTR